VSSQRCRELQLGLTGRELEEPERGREGWEAGPEGPEWISGGEREETDQPPAEAVMTATVAHSMI
jgi:hypothetical protein